MSIDIKELNVGTLAKWRPDLFEILVEGGRKLERIDIEKREKARQRKLRKLYA